jgi:2-polyprenyl-6-methoxyphenol hydroxylase-like FAD-dependent oxidoreductase
MRVRACLQTLHPVAVRCSLEAHYLQAISVRCRTLQFVWTDSQSQGRRFESFTAHRVRRPLRQSEETEALPRRQAQQAREGAAEDQRSDPQGGGAYAPRGRTIVALLPCRWGGAVPINTRSEAVEVLIIGAGPSGLFAALELARHGVQARLVEREPHPHHQARATALQPGTPEILAPAGVLEPVLASSVHLRRSRLLDADLRLVGETVFAGAGCQWEFQCSLPQWRTEEILAERLTQLDGRIERGVEVTSVEPREDGVLVSLKHGDGTSDTVDAGWVVGAGGAHSLLRHSIAETLVGETYPGTALVADVRVHCPLPRDASALIAGGEGYVLLAPLPEERWITFVGDLDDDEVNLLGDETSIPTVRATIQRRVGTGVRVDDVAWASTFRMQRRLVPKLADGRRFLLGDAGHLSSPFGGEGMNSGLHDAHNLAWKLALAVRGRARSVLVESYAHERLAADSHVLEVSDRIHESVHGAMEAARTGLAQPPPRAHADAVEAARSRTMLDVSYAGSPIVGEYLGSGEKAVPFPGPGDRFPARAELEGIRHHLLLFGTADEPALDVSTSLVPARGADIARDARAHEMRIRRQNPDEPRQAETARRFS